jgi:CD109 antigen
VEGLNGTKFSETASLQYYPNYCIAYIITDKNLYKPRDTVQFRVLIIDDDTKPYDMTNEFIDIFISNAKQSRIKKLKSIKLKNGVFKGEMKLPSEPVLGFWMIWVIGVNLKCVITINRHQ